MMAHNKSTCRFAVAALLCLLGNLFSTLATAAPATAGSNSSNGRIFGICFDDADGDGKPDPRTSASVDGGTSPVALAYYLDPTNIYGGNPENARKLFVADEKGAIRAFNWPSATSNDACDFSPSQDMRYEYNAAASPTGPASPNGLSVTRGKQLLVLDSKAGNFTSKLWRFDLRQGALDAPVLLDPAVSVTIDGQPVAADLLEEGLSLPGGDFLVASANPRAILKYDATCIAGPGPCSATTLLGPSNLPGTPAGIALAPAPLTSKLLVSATNGTVEVFDLSGGDTPQRQSTPLISGLNQGRFKIKTLRTVSGDDYQLYAGDLYLAGRNNGQIIQMNILDQDGVLTAPRDEYGNFVYQSLDSVQFPVGLATTEVDTISGETCSSPAGCNATAIMSHRIITNTPLPGALGEQYEVYAEPREACGGTLIPACPGEGEPGFAPDCDNSLSLQQLNPAYEDIRIPGNLCGAPNIVVVDVDSNIAINSEVIEHTIEYSNISDNLSCQGNDRGLQPVVTWATKAGEDPVVEGQRVVDMTTGCGSVRAWTKDNSMYVLGMTYSQADGIDSSGAKKELRQLDALFATIVREEIANLRATLEEAKLSLAGSCINDPEDFLGASLTDLETRYDRGQYGFAQAIADEIATRIETNSAIIGPKNLTCSENYRGELQARSRHIWYNINSKVLGKTWGTY